MPDEETPSNQTAKSVIENLVYTLEEARSHIRCYTTDSLAEGCVEEFILEIDEALDDAKTWLKNSG